MSNPHFMKAVAEFQHDPRGAMQKYQDNPEVRKGGGTSPSVTLFDDRLCCLLQMQSFLRDFCGLMGEHFAKLGDAQGSGAGATGASTPKPPPAKTPVTLIRPPEAAADIRPAPSPEDEKVRRALSNPEGAGGWLGLSVALVTQL